MLSRRWRSWSSALLLLGACGSGEDPLATATAAAAGGPPAVFLLPPLSARVGASLRLGLHLGGGLDAPSLQQLPSFDPFALRVGGHQDNALPVAVDDDGVGAHLTPTRAGDTMVGCSTQAARGICNGEMVELVHHAKSLFFVAGDGVESPVASAALTNRIGLDLEIVPMIDPLPLLPGETLPLQVHFQGEALADAPVTVRWTARDATAVAAEPTRSDEVGAVHVPIPANGLCLVTVVYDPLGSGAGRTVHTASLTFRVGAQR